MAKEHAKQLLAARDRLVADRRDLVTALAGPYKRGHTENMRECFITVQATIEAIDALSGTNSPPTFTSIPKKSPVTVGGCQPTGQSLTLWKPIRCKWHVDAEIIQLRCHGS
jgi:hypothetical protein